MKINFGCGDDYKDGWINVDKCDVKKDITHDLDVFPYPFEDNSSDYILCKSILEHLEYQIKALKEMHRILKPGGHIEIIVPHFSCVNAFADPTHKHFYSYKTFDFFCGLREYYFDFKFKMKSKRLIFGKRYALWNYLIEPLANLFPSIYENTIFRMFPCMNVKVIMEK